MATLTAEAPTRPKWTSRQLDAFTLLRDHPRVLLYGGSSSGKTRAHVEFDVTACLEFSGLRGLMLRQRRQHAKETLWHETLLGEVLCRYDHAIYEPNQSDLYVTFANGSEIWVSGTDDKERIEKILGKGVGWERRRGPRPFKTRILGPGHGWQQTGANAAPEPTRCRLRHAFLALLIKRQRLRSPRYIPWYRSAWCDAARSAATDHRTLPGIVHVRPP